MQRIALVISLVVAGAACSSGGSSGSNATGVSSSSPTATRSPTAGESTTATTAPADRSTTTARAPDLARARVGVVAVASGLDTPVAFAVRRGDDGLYVAEQHTGRVRVVRGGVLDPAPVLDLRGAVAQGGEQGLLGLAFSRDATKLYIDYTDPNGDTRVVEYAMRAGSADPSTRRQLLFVDQPYANHNGGQLVTGRDGMLYIALGDGGGAGDPAANAQNRGVLLGKILRLDPRPSAAGAAYSVPGDNPFVGDPQARPEIWQWGLRNPWRFSFDRSTGELWIADVGQDEWDEIDRVPAGRAGVNFGWDAREGLQRFEGARPPGAVDPVYVSSISGVRCAIIGGFVYRGAAIPDLVGAYVFSDFCEGKVLALDAAARERDLQVSVEQPTSFGEGNDGELYVLSATGTLYRLTSA